MPLKNAYISWDWWINMLLLLKVLFVLCCCKHTVVVCLYSVASVTFVRCQSFNYAVEIKALRQVRNALAVSMEHIEGAPQRTTKYNLNIRDWLWNTSVGRITGETITLYDLLTEFVSSFVQMESTASRHLSGKNIHAKVDLCLRKIIIKENSVIMNLYCLRFLSGVWTMYFGWKIE